MIKKTVMQIQKIVLLAPLILSITMGAVWADSSNNEETNSQQELKISI